MLSATFRKKGHHIQQINTTQHNTKRHHTHITCTTHPPATHTATSSNPHGNIQQHPPAIRRSARPSLSRDAPILHSLKVFCLLRALRCRSSSLYHRTPARVLKPLPPQSSRPAPHSNHDPSVSFGKLASLHLQRRAAAPFSKGSQQLEAGAQARRGTPFGGVFFFLILCCCSAEHRPCHRQSALSAHTAQAFQSRLRTHTASAATGNKEAGSLPHHHAIPTETSAPPRIASD